MVTISTNVAYCDKSIVCACVRVYHMMYVCMICIHVCTEGSISTYINLIL